VGFEPAAFVLHQPCLWPRRPSELRFVLAGRDRSCPAKTGGSRCLADPARDQHHGGSGPVWSRQGRCLPATYRVGGAFGRSWPRDSAKLATQLSQKKVSAMTAKVVGSLVPPRPGQAQTKASVPMVTDPGGPGRPENGRMVLGGDHCRQPSCRGSPPAPWCPECVNKSDSRELDTSAWAVQMTVEKVVLAWAERRVA
jgi:hypothetical protein